MINIKEILSKKQVVTLSLIKQICKRNMSGKQVITENEVSEKIKILNINE